MSNVTALGSRLIYATIPNSPANERFAIRLLR
jgi:hypothetical protein